MNSLMQALSKYYTLSKREGLQATFQRVWTKVVAHLRLQFRAIWSRFFAGQFLTDKGILKKTTGKWESLDELIDHLRIKVVPTFLFLAENKEEYVAILKERYSANVHRTLLEAENICQHRFKFLGSDFEFTARINWHLDPESGKSWPRDYFEFIDNWIWSDKRLGDYKLPWELNRHQYFFTLGKAYWLTGDEKYANECASQVLSWIRDNPQGIGVNWYSALEIGLRLISWVFAFHFFKESPLFISRAGKPFVKSLYQQASFLRRNLSLSKEVRNNHIIGEAAALIVVGYVFPEFEEAREWLQTGLQIFEQELSLQTFSDGANKEQAMGYHRFVLDFLMLIVVLARRGAIPASAQLEKLLEKMLNYVMYITMPNGFVPMIGDSDDGRGFVFNAGAQIWDFRAWLAAGAVLCKRSDFKFVVQDFAEEAFWLLGPEGLSSFEHLESSIPASTSFSFPLAGHYIIRDSWMANSDYSFFKCGPFGWGGEGFCSHSHSDLLSFVLCVNGIEMIIDSGTYTYHGSWRNQFRLAKAHNTIVVDNYDQAKPLRHFRWQNVPSAECLAWDGYSVAGGMQTLSHVYHRRDLSHPSIGTWDITDNLKGDGGVHQVSWFFHFARELILNFNNDLKKVTVMEHNNTCLTVVPPDGIYVEIKNSWGSNSYGKKNLLPLLQATWDGNIPSEGIDFHWKFVNSNEN